jgi:hypothetical protein
LDILIIIVAVILIIAFFETIIRGVFGALIGGIIGGLLFGQTGLEIGAVVGFLLNLDRDDKDKEKSHSKTSSDPEKTKKPHKQAKSENSKIIRCPYCRKKLRIKVPIPVDKGKCPACSGKFHIKEDGKGNIKVERDEPKNKSSYAGRHTTVDGCYKVLGISPTATPEEVRASYRKKIREYHPDRVAGLGEKLRKMADEESKQINKAYSELKTKGLAK